MESVPVRWSRERVGELIERLEALYGRPRILAHYDPMEELVSCILSQHTSDSNSFPAYGRMRKVFPDWAMMVAAGPEAVADSIRKAGLANQKAKNIVACLQAIAERNGGFTLEPLREMPLTEAERWLTQLPGVGPKTAAIVLGFAFGRDIVAVDTHVHRVSWRLGLIPEGTPEAKAHPRLQRKVPDGMAGRFHVTLISHGREVCRAPLPNCEACIVRDLCRWYRTGGPQKRERKLVQTRRAAVKRRRKPVS